MAPDFVTYDNPRNRDYQRMWRRLAQLGHVESMSPKTTLRIERFRGVKLRQLKAAVDECLDPRTGSAMLVTRLGWVREKNNRGNRRDTWVRKN